MSHFIPYDEPELVINVIRKWWRRHGKGKTQGIQEHDKGASEEQPRNET